MTSNMLAGERRWATARRGGMTVLGKVSVPKPLNLPSQRLENHGLDPNVEIVPKGTLSWGSRPSSSGSNPWISSSVSPNADGGTVSPSHLSGRPSSGGSGTRPSTAGSDRTHEPVASAWGSNSRPSSASGTLSSNQTSSTALRPRSAENRPNSSQLSRFAETVSKSSAAWGPSITAERLGVKSSKEDGFSLSSGDFPTLGTEKDIPVKNIESEGHGRPSSASGRIALEKEDGKYQADIIRGTVNTWRADGSQSAEDDIHSSMEKWHGDPHQYYNANAGPQHFDSWRGPPMNGPAGVWYGGRPRGPPFGAPVGPGGFPMEPYPYYRPQLPPPLAGPQPMPPPGPRGPHPKSGDLYRPQMPDAYARPGMPFRPGFYPGPRGPPGPMAFESYYGPPMGFCNNERDVPFMGVAAGPPVYNGYSAPAPDIGDSHSKGAGRGPPSKTLSEHVDADHFEDTEGPKRGLLRNHNERQRLEGENWEHNVQPIVSYPGKSHLPMITSRKNEWGAEEGMEETVVAKRKIPSGNSSSGYENRVEYADSVKVKSFEGMDNVKAVDNNWTNKSGSVSSFPPEMPHMPLANERDSSLKAATKNSALMHKIDGLNAKVRVSDGRHDSPSAYNMKEEMRGSQIVDKKINIYTGEVSKTDGSSERTPVSGDFVSIPREVVVSTGDKPIQPMAVVSRRPYHGEQGRDHRGKGKFNSQDADGWQRKTRTTESPSAVITANVGSAPDILMHGGNIVEETSLNAVINPGGEIEGDFETYDSTDIQAQRAKMRELAKQRALQLQKEEEERIKEQKAKALAKLEELNRRSLAGEATNQKPERTQAIGDIQGDQGERTIGEPAMVDHKFQEPGLNLVSSTDVADLDRDRGANHAEESGETSRNLPPQIQHEDCLESSAYPLPMHEDANDGGAKKIAAQFNDGGISRSKRTGYKQKQINSSEKGLSEISVSNVAPEAQKIHIYADISPHEVPSGENKMSESNVPYMSTSVVEPSTHQRRKNNRSSKNKHKLDETPAVPALPPVISNVNPGKESIGNSESKDSLSNFDGSLSTPIVPDRVPVQDVSSLPNEESQSRGSNQWRPHQSRKLPRNQQANRFVDKVHGSDTVIWAPVRSENKAKGSVEASQRSTQESANSVKSDNAAQNSMKGKRAEMERYVPKPVAKELAQQGSIQPSSSSSSSSRPSEGADVEHCRSASSVSPQPASSTSALVVSSLEINERDASRNKHKKDQGTWRQRASTDSSHVKGGVHIASPSTSEPTKDIKQSKELKPETETNSAHTEIPTFGTISTGDYYNMQKNTTAAVSKYPSVKDQGAVTRGKRHPPRGPRGTATSPDPENTSSGEIDGSCIQSGGPDSNQTDRTVVPKDNRSFAERKSSHWQPKSNSNSAINQHGNRTGSEPVTTEIIRPQKKDRPQHEVHVAPRNEKESGNVSQPQPGKNVDVKSNVTEESILGHRQEFNREHKPAPSKGSPNFPHQDIRSGESPPPTAKADDHHLDRNIPPGSRRNVRQQNRSSRGGHESRGDWSSGYDSRPHNVPSFRDRQRQNMHYEYQPVVPSFKSDKPEKVEEPVNEVNEAERTDQRRRERGQSQSKRGGNFYRRQSGPVHLDSGRN